MIGKRDALVGAAVAVSVLTLSFPSGAQSLAEIARKEAEKRGKPLEAGQTYTNENLVPDFTKPAEPAPSPAASAAAAEAGADTKPQPKTEGDGVKKPVVSEADATPDGVTPRDQQEPQPKHDKDEAYWRGRAQLIRSRLNLQNAKILQLKKQVDSFSLSSTNPERDVAVAALRQAQDNLVELNQEWLRFERMARERSVPDTWIR